jgi:hypothetical protein
LITRSHESFPAARELRLAVSGNPAQYDDLSRFIDEQDLLRRLVRESRLPSLEVDISDNNIARATEAIADWLSDSRGLSMP